MMSEITWEPLLYGTLIQDARRHGWLVGTVYPLVQANVWRAEVFHSVDGELHALPGQFLTEDDAKAAVLAAVNHHTKTA